MTVQERFAEEFNMPLREVRRLAKLAHMRAKFAEHEANGDPFPGMIIQGDKNLNANLWDAAVSRLDYIILQLVDDYGFTDVVSTGLGPTLKRGERYVEIPY